MLLLGFLGGFELYCNIGAQLVAGRGGTIRISATIRNRPTLATPPARHQGLRMRRAPSWRVIHLSLPANSKVAEMVRHALIEPRLYLLLPLIGIDVAKSMRVSFSEGGAIAVYGWRKGKPIGFASWPLALAEFRDGRLVGALEDAAARAK